jgi:creatine kinase
MTFFNKIIITLGILLSHKAFSLPLCIEEFNSLSAESRVEIKKSAIKNNVDMDLIFISGRQHQDSQIGCYMPNQKAYEVLRPMIVNLAEKYHNHQISGEYKSDFDVSSLRDVELDPEKKYIISSRVRVARNISGYPFPSSISKRERKILEKRIFNVLKTLRGELKGRYYSLETMSHDQIQSLIADHLLFEIENKFLESAKISRDMPNGRGIFISQDKKFIVWVGEEDILKIMSLNDSSDILATFAKVSEALSVLGQRFSFAFDKELGYLTSCPTNIGTTMRASVHIRLPNISKRADFKEICNSLGLQIRATKDIKSQSSDGVFDISNASSIGKSEKELLEQLILSLQKLINLEKEYSN